MFYRFDCTNILIETINFLINLFFKLTNPMWPLFNYLLKRILLTYIKFRIIPSSTSVQLSFIERLLKRMLFAEIECRIVHTVEAFLNDCV